MAPKAALFIRQGNTVLFSYIFYSLVLCLLWFLHYLTYSSSNILFIDHQHWLLASLLRRYKRSLSVKMTESQTHRDSFSEKTMTDGSANENANDNINGSKDAVNEKQTDTTATSPKNDSPPAHEYPGVLSLTAIMVAVYLAIFLVALVSILHSLQEPEKRVPD